MAVEVRLTPGEGSPPSIVPQLRALALAHPGDAVLIVMVGSHRRLEMGQRVRPSAELRSLLSEFGEVEMPDGL